MLNYVQVLKDLIRMDTTNPPGNEMRLLAYIASLLKLSGATIATLPLADGQRGNLVAHLQGQQQGLPPLVLLSHTDVVPAEASQWRYPPFEAVEADGFIYGRGAVDTKQLTVMELAAFLALSKSGPLNRDVYLVATGDEECGSELGLRQLLRDAIPLGNRAVPASELFQGSLVISEGGGFPILANGRALYLVETGQKGCGQVSFTFCEPGGAYLAGTGALKRAVGLVQELHQTRMESRVTPTLLQFEAALCAAFDCTPSALPTRLNPMMGNILASMRRNTLTPTLVAGPSLRDVTVTCDVRLLPGFDLAYLEALTKPLAEKWGAQLRVQAFHPGYESDAGEPVRVLAECLNREHRGDDRPVPLVPFLSMGSSDGRFLQPMGASVFGFSPVLPADMTFDQAVRMVHGVDERIHRDSLLFGCRVLTRAARRLCGVAEKEDA